MASDEKTKCGEMYRNNNNGAYTFVCYHCANEYESFNSIVKHVEQHMTYLTQLAIKEEKPAFADQIISTEHSPLYTYSNAADVSTDSAEQAVEPPVEYICDLCDKSYPQEKALHNHMRCHRPKANDKLQCNMCKQEFSTATAHRLHLDRDNYYTTDELTCKHCDQSFQYPCEYSYHTLSHTTTSMANDIKLNCLTCGTLFDCRKMFDDHMPSHTANDSAATVSHVVDAVQLPFVCDICAKGHATQKRLSHHKRWHKQLSCPHCEARFLSKRTLDKHLEQTQQMWNESQAMCKYCDTKFEHSCLFRLHFRAVHTRETTCLICDRQCVDQYTLTRHMRYNHLTPDSACDRCGLKVRGVSNMNLHMRTHTNERPFECEWCGKSFPLQNTLKLHVQSHMGDKPCQCTTCGKTFYSVGMLNEHMKNHTNVRQYKCGRCRARFMHLKNLREHEQRHQSTMIECDVCGKRFRSKKTVRQHMFLHREEKLFPCRFCEMKFSQSTGRRGHERQRHNAL